MRMWQWRVGVQEAEIFKPEEQVAEVEPEVVYECATTGKEITVADLQAMSDEELEEWTEAMKRLT